MISVFTLPNGQQIIGKILEEKEDALIVSYPLLMIFANPMSVNTTVYTTRYMPMADKGIVTFNKCNLVGISGIDTPLEHYYEKMVEFYKAKPPAYRTNDNAEEEQDELEKIATVLANSESDSDENPLEVVQAMLEARNKTVH